MNKVIIIAEAGVNHNGDLKKAIELIDVAADSGADFVKFQTFKANKVVTPNAKKAKYQINNINDGDDNQFQMLKKLEIPLSWYPILTKRCYEKGIKFLSTGFDIESVCFLEKMNLAVFKIPSGEITNKPLIEEICKFKKEIILSTGMANIAEIKQAIDLMIFNGIQKKMITVLHCNTQYPTPYNDVNLLAMNHIKKELNVNVGYSDHTEGIEIPIAAVSLGAKVIEKHFTLDKNLEGPDHIASLNPTELKQMIKSIRNVENAISGDGIKSPSKSEFENIKIARKSLHYAKNLKINHEITKNDLIPLRPNLGISPMQIDEILGKKLTKNVFEYDLVKYNDFENE